MSDEPVQRVTRKRNQALIALSHDHHLALVRAMQLKRVDEQNREAAIRDFLDFWHSHAQRHFAAEEAVLLPAFARHCGSTDETVVRVLTDHLEIRRRALDLERGEDTQIASLEELGTLLEAHVRLEERVLFARIEEALTTEELEGLGAALLEAEGQGR